MRVLQLSVGMEAAVVGVEVEAWTVGGVGRQVVGHPSPVSGRRKVDGNVLSLIKARSVAYLAVLN